MLTWHNEIASAVGKIIDYLEKVLRGVPLPQGQHIVQNVDDFFVGLFPYYLIS